jgi:hypothetical protein
MDDLCTLARMIRAPTSSSFSHLDFFDPTRTLSATFATLSLYYTPSRLSELLSQASPKLCRLPPRSLHQLAHHPSPLQP